jgi:hypothetical protein
VATFKVTATLKPEPTQHIKPTIVLAYIASVRVATFNPTCLSRLIPTQGRLVLGLLIVSDVNGA